MLARGTLATVLRLSSSAEGRGATSSQQREGLREKKWRMETAWLVVLVAAPKKRRDVRRGRHSSSRTLALHCRSSTPTSSIDDQVHLLCHLPSRQRFAL